MSHSAQLCVVHVSQYALKVKKEAICVSAQLSVRLTTYSQSALSQNTSLYRISHISSHSVDNCSCFLTDSKNLI